jgi:hypothetical protein
MLPVIQLMALELAETLRVGSLERFEVYQPGELVSVLYGPLMGHSGAIVNRKGKDHWVVEIQPQKTKILVPGFLLQPISPVR